VAGVAVCTLPDSGLRDGFGNSAISCGLKVGDESQYNLEKSQYIVPRARGSRDQVVVPKALRTVESSVVGAGVVDIFDYIDFAIRGPVTQSGRPKSWSN
jgi:hypothetical protein